MPTKTGYAGRTIVTIVFGFVVALLSLGSWWVFIGLGVPTFTRTASARTTFVSAEDVADGATIHYSFYDRKGVFHSGKTWTSSLIGVINDAKDEKPITIWYDPNDTNNSSVEQPQFWSQWPLAIFGLGLIAMWVGSFVLFLDNSWGWGIFKKKATDSPKETVTRLLKEIRQISDVGKRHGALKGTWDTSNMEIRMEICHQLGADVETARGIVGKDFIIDGDMDFGALLKALDPT